METEVDTFAKSALISFFDNEKNASRYLLRDIECSYRAEEIIYIFQAVSSIFFQIFVGMVSAYLFHLLYQKRNAKKAQDQLEKKIQSVVKDHEKQLEYHMKRLEEKMLAKTEENIEHQKRFNLYRKKVKFLRESTNTIRYLIEILEVEFSKSPQEQEKHVSQYRDR